MIYLFFFFNSSVMLFNHQLQYACRVAVQRASQQLIVWKDFTYNLQPLRSESLFYV